MSGKTDKIKAASPAEWLFMAMITAVCLIGIGMAYNVQIPIVVYVVFAGLLLLEIVFWLINIFRKHHNSKV